MPRPVTKLTDKRVKAAKPQEKEQTLSDGGGLQLRVLPSGTKSWQFKYKNPVTGKYNKMPLGIYPDKSLSDARDDAADKRKLLANGIDPKTHKLEKKKEEVRKHNNTFIAAAEL